MSVAVVVYLPDGSFVTLSGDEPQAQTIATIRAAATNALATNATFLGLATPTNAQVLAQVQALTRQMDGVIRLLTGRLEATG